MASVDGYTKAGADAAFAPIGHTHAGGGGGGSGFKGAISFDSNSASFASDSGGTMMTPIDWVLWSSHSGGVEGVMDSAYPNVTADNVDGFVFPEAGWYQANLRAHVRFPSSSPDFVVGIINGGAWIGRGCELQVPVGINTRRSASPSATFDLTTAPFWADVDDYLRPKIWWPGTDTAPTGDYVSVPGGLSIPGINFTVYKLV